MRYTKGSLEGIVQSLLKIARENLTEDGYLKPVGVIFNSVGLTNVFEFRCQDAEQKRASQDAFKKLVKQTKALAVVVITESWLKMAPDIPLNLDQSVADMTGRQEAIVIEGLSGEARVFMIQVFRKDKSGVLFDEPLNAHGSFTWTSEWTEGLKLGKADDHDVSIQ